MRLGLGYIWGMIGFRLCLGYDWAVGLGLSRVQGIGQVGFKPCLRNRPG